MVGRGRVPSLIKLQKSTINHLNLNKNLLNPTKLLKSTINHLNKILQNPTKLLIKLLKSMDIRRWTSPRMMGWGMVTPPAPMARAIYPRASRPNPTKFLIQGTHQSPSQSQNGGSIG